LEGEYIAAKGMTMPYCNNDNDHVST
jgi:hypothetical protein